jgi:hypothetical protein
VTITGISADTGYVDIAVSADGKALGTTRFSFLKVRQGQSTKLYLAWADSADGTIGFSTTVAIDKKYMGTYTTTSNTQSTDPTVYKWIETSNAFTLGGRNYLLNSDFLDDTSYWTPEPIPAGTSTAVVTDTDGSRFFSINTNSVTETGAFYVKYWNSGEISVSNGDTISISGYLRRISGSTDSEFISFEELDGNRASVVFNSRKFTTAYSDLTWDKGSFVNDGNTWNRFTIKYKVTGDTSRKLRVCMRNTAKSKLDYKNWKLEGGTVATEWSANPEDYYRRLDTVRTTANAANTSITEMASDTKLTGLEKIQVNKEVEVIKAEYPLLTAQADTYSITAEKTTYTSKYNTLISYITPLLSSLTTTSDIVAATFRNTFKDYYTAKTNLVSAIYTTLNTRTSNTAQTTLVQLTNVVQDITGWSATVSEQYIRQATGGTNPQILSSLQSTIKSTARSIDLTVQDNGQLTPTGQSINSKYATIRPARHGASPKGNRA